MTQLDAMRFSKRLRFGPVFNGSSCWEWTGAKNVYGYGQFIINGKKYYAQPIHAD